MNCEETFKENICKNVLDCVENTLNYMDILRVNKIDKKVWSTVK